MAEDKEKDNIISEDKFLLPEMGDFYLGAVDTEYLKILDQKINRTSEEDANDRRIAFMAETPPSLKAETQFQAGNHGYFVEVTPEFTDDLKESGLLDGKTIVFKISSMEERSGIKANQDKFKEFKESILEQSKITNDSYIKNDYAKFIINGLDLPSTSIWAVDHIEASNDPKSIKINGSPKEVKKMKDGTYKYLLKTGDVQRNEKAENRLEDLVKKNGGKLYLYIDNTDIGKTRTTRNVDNKDAAIDFSNIRSLTSVMDELPKEVRDELEKIGYSRKEFNEYVEKESSFKIKDKTVKNYNINSKDLFENYFKAKSKEKEIKEILEKYKDKKEIKKLKNTINSKYNIKENATSGVSQIGLDMNTLTGTAYFKTDNKWFNAGKYLLSAEGDTEAKPSKVDTKNKYISNNYDIEQQKFVDAFNSVFDEIDDRYEIQKKLLGQDKYILNDWTVLLGDVLFMVPPETIILNGENGIETAPLLRAQSRMVKTNFQSNRRIGMTVFFYGDKGINGFPYVDTLPNGKEIVYHMNGLRALLSQFKFTPYLPIENKLLNEVYNIHAVTINDINITNDRGNPRLYKVEISLTEFDPSTYISEHMQMMVTLGIEEKDRNYFAAAINWKLFRYYYQKPIIQGNDLFSKKYEFNSFEYAKEHLKNRTLFQPMRFRNSTLNFYVADEEYLEMMMDQRMEDLYGVNGIIKPKNKEQWDELTRISELGDALAKACASKEWNDEIKKFSEKNKTIKGYTDKRSVSQKNFKTTEFGKTLNVLKGALDKIEFNNKKDITNVSYRMNTDYGKNDDSVILSRISIDISLKKENYPYYLNNKINVHEDSNAKNSGRLSKENSISISYVAKYVKDKDGKYILEKGYDLDTTNEGSQLLSAADRYTKQRRYSDFDMNSKNTAKENEEASNDWKKPASVYNYSMLRYTPVNLADIIVEEFQVVFSNNFVMTSTLNASSPAPQYMGGNNVEIRLNMVTQNKESLSYLAQMLKTINYCEKKYRMILPCYPLKIESEITKFLDVNDVMITNIDISTIEKTPGWYEISISLMSVDRTLRQREAMSAIEGINSGWKEPSWFQDEYKYTDMANFELLKKIIGQVEVYPDLELPKISELEELGFKFTRYLFQDERIYVDPDFYFLYFSKLTSQVLRDSVMKLIKPDGPLNGDEVITDESGAQFTLAAKKNKGTVIENMNEIAKSQQGQMNDAIEASKKIELKKLSENIKEAARQKGQENNLDIWEIAKDIKTVFLEKKYDKELKSNVARKKANESTKANNSLIKDNDISNKKTEVNYKNQDDSSIKAPNGEYFKQNDIDYLKNNGHSEKEAIKILSKLDKYKKQEIIKNTEDNNKKNKQKEEEKTEEQKKEEELNQKLIKNSIEREKIKITEGQWIANQVEKSKFAANDFLYYLENRPITLREKMDKIYDIEKDVKVLEATNESFIARRSGMVDSKADIDYAVKYWFKFEATVAFCDALYININDNFLSVVSDIIYAAACNATADKEYSSKQKSTNWKPNRNFLGIVNGSSQDDYEKQEAKTVKEAVDNAIEFGMYRFKMYSQGAIDNITNHSNKIINDSTKSTQVNKEMFTMDPYYRKNKNEVPNYKLNCIMSTKYATIAFLRNVFYWLAKITQENVYPSVNSDILRKAAKVEMGIQKVYQETNVSTNVDDQLLKNIEFFRKNEYQIDSGKIFVAVLLTACDGDSKLLSRIKAKEYSALSSYQKGCIIPGKIITPNETSAMVFRKTIMALAGIGRIKDIDTSGVIQNQNTNSVVSMTYEKKYIESAENPAVYSSHSCHDAVVYDARGRMLRAYPTFYMMLIDEGRDVGKWHLHDNYYNNNAISQISITRSKDNPIDVAEITMSNFYSSFMTAGDDALYPNSTDLTLMDSFVDLITPIVLPSEQKKIEERERTIKDVKPSLQLVAGTKLTIKLGYGSNPNLMPTVFNGVIAEVSAEDEIILQCSGYGSELVNPILEDIEAYHLPREDDIIGAFANTDSPINIARSLFTRRGGALKRIGSHIPIISDYIDRNAFGITNFGNPDFKEIFEESGECCQNIFAITAPNKVTDKGEIVPDGSQTQISFDVFGRSPWDVLHICKSLNPDAIVGIRNFGLRQTVFMGLNRYYYAYDYSRDSKTNSLIEKRKPFQQFHFYNSYQDIIQNGWVASTEEMHTVAVGLYENTGSFNSISQEKIGPLYADIDIYPDYQKTMTYDTGLITKGIPYLGMITNSLFNNEYVEDFMKSIDLFDAQDDKGVISNNQDIAWKMTASGLRQAVARMYAGDMVVIGDPSVNPHDRICVYDEVNGIRGQAIVREVNHTISVDGFTTTITPEAIVVVDDPFENATHSILKSVQNIVTSTTYIVNKINAFRKAMKTGTIIKTALNIFSIGIKGAVKTGSKFVPYLGEVLFVANFALLRFSRFARNMQVTKIYPLQRYGLPWTAGVNGQKGMVYGSQTQHQQGALQEGLAAVFGSRDNFLLELVQSVIVPPELEAAVDKYKNNTNEDTLDKLDKNEESDKYSKYKDGGRFAATVKSIMASNNGTVKQKSLAKTDYRQIQINQRADYSDPKSIKASYDFFNIESSEKWFANNKLTRNRLISRDTRFAPYIKEGFFKIIHETPGLNEGKNVTTHTIKLDSQETYIKAIEENKDGSKNNEENNNKENNKENKENKENNNKEKDKNKENTKNKVYDIPMLNPEALNILFEIIRRAKNNMPAANASDPYENYEETKSSFIALESALRIGDKESIAGAGYTFILHGVDKAAPALANAIRDFYKEIESDAKDNSSLNAVIFDSKDLGNNKIAISCRMPLLVQPKSWDDSGEKIKTNPEAENKINKETIGDVAVEEKPPEIKQLKYNIEDMDGTSGLGIHQEIKESLLKILK